MSRILLPSRLAVCTLAGLAVAASAAAMAPQAAGGGARLACVAGGLAGLLLAAFVADVAWSAWLLRRHPIAFERRLPDALAIGQPHPVHATLRHEGAHAWRLELFDHVPQTMRARQLPARLRLPRGSRLDVRYEVTPTRRGTASFEPAALRVRSRLGLADLQVRAGVAQALPVYPNFAAIARYAWLAGDRRLAEIGIKTYAARGSGTDFRQLGEYLPGMSTRHIDWNASLRHRRPVVREFQDDRDQTVMFLLDCGRRMRADDGPADADEGHGGSHFDQALNALMLLAYVALRDGDAVGAMTFGHDAALARHCAPAKGAAALNTMVARLHDVEPTSSHSDYLAAARDLMLRQPRRSLVVVLTNFRDEDCPELESALALMRTRHLVLLASLRERIVACIAAQPLVDARAVAEAAAAHWFGQARADAFRRLAGRDRLLLDVEPRQLAAALVNRYHAVKRARML